MLVFQANETADMLDMTSSPRTLSYGNSVYHRLNKSLQHAPVSL